MRCVFYSEFKNAYYVRVRHKGKELSRSFFSTPEEAMVVRDDLERRIGKVA
jgi:peptidyl-tRNA hydrolase